MDPKPFSTMNLKMYDGQNRDFWWEINEGDDGLFVLISMWEKKDGKPVKIEEVSVHSQLLPLLARNLQTFHNHLKNENPSLVTL